MSEPLEIEFASLSAAPAGTLVVLAGEELALGAAARGFDERSKGACQEGRRAPPISPARPRAPIEILAPAGIDTQRMHPARHGPGAPRSSIACCWAAPPSPRSAPARARRPASSPIPPIPARSSAEVFAADLALGALLRSYTFKKYRTKRKPEDGAEERAARDGLARLVDPVRQARCGGQGVRSPQGAGRGRVPRPRSRQRAGQHAGPRRVRRAHARADRAPASRSRCWTRTSSRALKMGALLAVGQGSERPSRVVVHAVARRQVQARQAAVLRRQGRVLRHRRHLHEAGRRHGGHEGRHGRGGLRRRPDAGARQAQGRRQRRRPASASPRTCPRARRSAPATSSPACRARPSRCSTPTPRAGSCWPTCSGTRRSASSRASSSIWRR